MSKGIFAAAVALATVIAGSAQAAIVRYSYEARDVDGYTQVDVCVPGVGCYNDSYSTESGHRIVAHFDFDTNAGGLQLGDPTGYGYTYILGGQNNYGSPTTTTASFLAFDGLFQGNYGSFAANHSSSLIGGFETNIYARMEDSRTEIDALTGDTLRIVDYRTLHALMTSTAPLVNVDGTWVPGQDPMATGQLNMSQTIGIDRYSAGGQYLGSRYVNYSFYSSMARSFMNGPTPVPEPGTVGLLGLGVLLLAAGRRAKRSAGVARA